MKSLLDRGWEHHLRLGLDEFWFTATGEKKEKVSGCSLIASKDEYIFCSGLVGFGWVCWVRFSPRCSQSTLHL